MKILVTGSAGQIGRVVCPVLETRGHQIVRFDLARGQNILNPDQIRAAIQNCEAVVHLAALLGHENESAEDIMAVNLLGTYNLLAAAQEAEIKRVVFFSSAEVLGVFRGERKPDYLPLDDFHLCYPTSPYAISKKLAEEMCEWWTKNTGIPTICLRLPGVFEAETYEFIRDNRRANPELEWHPFWQFGAFLDGRDAAQAARCALECSFSGNDTFLLCADDISSAQKTSRELVEMLLPDVEWRGGPEFETEPFKALIDTRRAQEILGWKPQFQWRN